MFAAGGGYAIASAKSNNTITACVHRVGNGLYTGPTGRTGRTGTTAQPASNACLEANDPRSSVEVEQIA
jgi:hypothetical protein